MVFSHVLYRLVITEMRNSLQAWGVKIASLYLGVTERRINWRQWKKWQGMVICLSFPKSELSLFGAGNTTRSGFLSSCAQAYFFGPCWCCSPEALSIPTSWGLPSQVTEGGTGDGGIWQQPHFPVPLLCLVGSSPAMLQADFHGFCTQDNSQTFNVLLYLLPSFLICFGQAVGKFVLNERGDGFVFLGFGFFWVFLFSLVFVVVWGTFCWVCLLISQWFFLLLI